MSTFLVSAIAWACMYGAPSALLVVCALYVLRAYIPRTAGVCVLLVVSLFVWARYGEPYLIRVHTTSVETGFTSRFALISDTHLGIFKDERFLERVVEKINETDVPYVFIAGDLTYLPKKENIQTLFAPLGHLKAKAYAVLGNHDVYDANYTFREELVDALEKNGVTVLENKRVPLDGFALVGIGDHYAKEDDVSVAALAENTHTVMLTHNPDSAMQLEVDVPLSLSGHTHCGQVRIPFIYKQLIPTEYDFDGGLYTLPHTTLFITCGLGESGVPLRLFNPPTVDVIETR